MPKLDEFPVEWLATITDVAGLSWQDEALCAQIGPEFFFPKKGDTATTGKQICGECPVKQECLDYAVHLPSIPDGIWGGLVRTQIMAIRRELGITDIEDYLSREDNG